MTLILSLLGTFGAGLGSLFSWVVSWFQAKEAAQNSANAAESTAEQQHNADGAQSVADQQSDDAQNAALNGIENQLKNPVPVVVTPPPKGTT